MSTIWTFDNIENKHALYCGENCMKKLCTLREHTKDIIDFYLYNWYNWEENINVNKTRTKIRKVHCRYTGKYRGAAHTIRNLKVASATFSLVCF